VGKSTLVNHMVGQKVSIVSDKPQTTRRRIIGIAQGEGYQIAFIDTPGIHEPHTRLGRAMVDAARGSLDDVDAILYVADGSHHPGDLDREIVATFQPVREKIPVLLCMNKMDLLKAENVQRNVDAYTALLGVEEYMLTTATKGENVDRLLQMIVERLPEGSPLFPEDEFTDQSMRFMAGELIREKILQRTRQEIPHSTAVVVDRWEENERGLLEIDATILVERASQRSIVIGKGGQFLKAIGTEAREEIEQLLERKVFLQMYVKVREDWRMNPSVLQELEYTE
jgi:GTPase